MPIVPENTFAAIDLGSNSFHLLVATFRTGQLQQIDKVKQMVRLAASLTPEKHISEDGLERAFECLRLFAQRIKNIPNDHIKVVGTNTLRVAKNADAFLQQAEAILNHDIDIISGREEARMLYLGVAQSMSEHLTRKLVMDIGGGSTELILGQGLEAKKRESLHMGCVSYTHRFFKGGIINHDHWHQAYTHALQQLTPVKRPYKRMGWTHAIGASGTMRAAAKILVAHGWNQTGINRNGLKQLIDAVLNMNHTDELTALMGLSVRRAPVFIGGLAIIAALMDALDIDHMSASTGALREGLVYSMGGDPHPERVTHRSLKRLQKQFDVDLKQCQRVLSAAESLCQESNFQPPQNDLFLLHSAIRLHEIGLSIAHSQFQKHGAYVVQYADLPGFSRQQQILISHLIRNQRRKIAPPASSGLTEKQWHRALPLLLILRLAVIFCRDRKSHQVPIDSFHSNGQHHQLKIDQKWLEKHPLILADLMDETMRWKAIGHQFELIE